MKDIMIRLFKIKQLI